MLKEFDGNGQAVYEKKVNKITPRMLLSHTAGFGYKLLNERSFRTLPDDHVEHSGRVKGLCVPLLFQPGTDWCYGVCSEHQDQVFPQILRR